MAVKNKADAEKFQRQLLELLKDEPNRICADCHARGPRWASWNLGVFICIRCAGMHRNLGVHIAKVKSVNLDTWTQEQVDNMLAWGNGIANEYYEYKLPPDFRRPKDDVEVEKLIRNKYDKKLYIHENFDYASFAKHHPVSSPSSNRGGAAPVSRRSDTTSIGTTFKKTPARVEPAHINAPTRSIPVVPLKTSSEAYVPPTVSAPKPVAKKAPIAEQPSLLQVAFESAPLTAPPTATSTTTNSDLVDLFGDMVSSVPNLTSTPTATANTSSENTTNKEEPKKSVKDSIMSLYGPTPPSGGFTAPPSGGFTGNFGGTMAPQQQLATNGAAFPGMQFPHQFSNPGPVPQSNGTAAPHHQRVTMQQQFSSGVPSQMMYGNQQQQFGQQQQQFGQQQQQFGQQQQQFGQQQQQFGQQQQQFGQQQFNQSQRQQSNVSFASLQNGAQNLHGANNIQMMNNMQLINNLQGTNVQGFNNQQQAFSNNSSQRMNNGQGITMNNGMNNMMGATSPQFGSTSGHSVNQQQHLDSIQRQLQQLKVGQGQPGWAQASGTG